MKIRYLVAALIGCVWLSWFGLVIYGPSLGLFFEPETESRFGTSGAFGDSFGVVASLMTTVAAVAVYLTYYMDKEDRAAREFESNFFTLLKNFESITSQIRIELLAPDENIDYESKYERLQRVTTTKVVRSHQGRMGIAVVLLILRDRLGPNSYSDTKVVAKAYDATFDHFVSYLGHYFRTLYHIYRLIEEKCQGDKDYYARIIRAQLSNPELCLLAYNCIVGEGRHKFKTFASKYSIFHNLHREGLDEYQQAELQFFLRKLPKNAFRFDPVEPITYDN